MSRIVLPGLVFSNLCAFIAHAAPTDEHAPKVEKKSASLCWDLRDGNEIRQVQLPQAITQKNAQIIKKGPIDITMRLPDKRRFHSQSASFIVVRRAATTDRVYWILVQSEPLSLDAAYKRGRELCDDFQVGHKQLTKWYSRALEKPNTVSNFERSNNSASPSYTIGVLATFERPRRWHITFQITWERAQKE